MVDPGENIYHTVKREFQEEATNMEHQQEAIEKLFSNGEKIFEYYCDDPRNTDNAWLETVAMYVRMKIRGEWGFDFFFRQFHDETGSLTRNIKLNAGK